MGGYDAHNDLEEEALPAIAGPGVVSWNASGMHRADDIDMATVRRWLQRPLPLGPRVLIANVLGGRHFVLVVGWDAMDGDTLIVRDSGFNRTTYSHARDVVGWRVFDMAPQDDKRPPKLSEDFAVSTVERDSGSGSNSGSNSGSSAGNAILQHRARCHQQAQPHGGQRLARARVFAGDHTLRPRQW